jgi:hypothetical protein
MLRRVRWVVAASVTALVSVGVLSGCSADDDCAGTSYDADLSRPGAADPIAALDDWLADQTDFSTPPAEDWVQQDGGAEAAEVVVTNDSGDGWWVSVLRTADGGWVVDAATDNAEGCSDDLS